jgi:hypothetical protein
MVDIKGLDKARVLKALYEHSKGQGMSFLDPEYGSQITTEECREILKGQVFFDYFRGRVMKVNLASDTEFDGRLYDRDNGQGAAELAVLDEFTRPDTK